MSTRLLGIGDLHSKRSNQDELKECAHKISAQVSAQKPNAIVILGDLGNDHERAYLVALNGMVTFLELVNSAAISVGAKIYYIIGNHDAENNQIFLENAHIMNVFRYWPNITIVDQPMRLKSPDGYITMCPYVPPGMLVKALDTIGRDQWMESSIIFCHQEFLGAQLGSIPSKVGDKWDESWPQVVSGHIHTYGNVGNNVLYIGAPMYHTFADEGDKSISLLNLDQGAMTETRLDLGMPAKITVHLTVVEASSFVVPENAHLRLYISGTTQELSKFKKSKKYDELMHAAKIIPQITDPVKVAKNVHRKGYLDILKSDCDKENKHVKDAFDEISQKGNV